MPAAPLELCSLRTGAGYEAQNAPAQGLNTPLCFVGWNWFTAGEHGVCSTAQTCCQSESSSLLLSSSVCYQINSVHSQEQSREWADAPAWVRFAGVCLDFFRIFFYYVAILVARLDTDCRFFNIFSSQMDLTWATKSRTHSRGCALFLQPCLLLSSERKSERNPFSWHLCRKDFYCYQFSKHC